MNTIVLNKSNFWDKVAKLYKEIIWNWEIVLERKKSNKINLHILDEAEITPEIKKSFLESKSKSRDTFINI